MTTRIDLRSLRDRCNEVVRRLKDDAEIGPHVDDSLPAPMPFVGNGPIELVVLGQDPTVDVAASRESITTALNLDKPGALRSYVERICASLGVEGLDGVFATNVCKNFFNERPTTIDDDRVLRRAADVWMPLLKDELAHFPDATVVTLGEPVLSILVSPGHSQRMKSYWGHHPKWQDGTIRPFAYVPARYSVIKRDFFPVIHQPSLQQPFYNGRFDDYMTFIREQIALGERQWP